MKKLLVLLMVVAAMVFVVSAAMADVKDPVLVDGKVEVTWTAGSGTGFAGSCAGAIKMDVSKDFGSGITAGYALKLASPGVFGLDGDGWIKMDYKTLVVDAKTGGLGGNAGNAITPGVTGAAGVKLTVLPVDGITGFVSLSGPNDGMFDVVGAKYSKDGITIGGGYQLDGAMSGTNATGFAAFAGYGKDAISASAEFCSLNNLMAYYATAGYTAGSLAVDAAVIGKDTTTYAYGDDADAWSAFTTFKKATVSGLAAKGHAKLTMGASWVEGNGQYTTGTGLEALSYKAAAGTGLGNLSLSAYYQSYTTYEVEGKAEYKIVPDKLKGWAEVLYGGSTTVKCGLVYTPVGGIEASTEVNVLAQSASAKLSATL